MSYKLIQTRSPFFIKYDTVNDTVTLGLKIWTGTVVGDKPTSNQYTLSKEALSGAGTFEIAELIRDYINHTSTTSSGSVWVEAIIGDGIGTDDTYTFLANEGYTLTNEGTQHAENQSLQDGVLLPLNSDGSYRISTIEGGNAVIPIVCHPSNSTDWYYNFGTSNQSLLASTTSTSVIRYISVPTGNLVCNFTFNGVAHKVYIDYMECNKYDSNQLLYVNKLGAKVLFPFNLKNMENISFKDQKYSRSLMNYSTLSDVSGLHSTVKQIRSTNQIITLNTDWMSEYYVQQIEELVFSEYVWLKRPTGNPQPVNIKTSKHLKKNHLNDKLINYTIEVEAASEYINTTR